MDLKQLTTFKTAATALSFTRAAAALNYVQSSVTAQIQALEAELGVRLFDRLGKRVMLTEAGERLLGYADRILALEEEARTVVAGTAAPPRSLTIGAPETLCTYRLPEVLRRFRECFPEVGLRFRPQLMGDLRRLMSESGVDICFVLEQPVKTEGLIVETLRAEPLVLVASPDHPLTRLPAVYPHDLEGEQMLLTEVGCGYRIVLDRSLAAAGVRPAATTEFDSVEAIKQCAIAGMGIAVLPLVTAQGEIDHGRLVALPWTEPNFQVLTQMVLHRDRWRSPALNAFADVARETLAEDAPGGAERRVAPRFLDAVRA